MSNKPKPLFPQDNVKEALAALALAWYQRQNSKTYYAKAMPGCGTCRDEETYMEKNLKCDDAFIGILTSNLWKPRG